jgi:hypothetical protein
MDLKQVARLVADAAAKAQAYEALFGPPTERLLNQTRYEPRDPQFGLAILHSRPGPAGKDDVSDLVLYVRDGVNLTLNDLRSLFGDDRKIVPGPEGNPHRRRWVYDPDGTQFGATVIAEFSGDPEAKGSRLERITFIRQRRRAS